MVPKPFILICDDDLATTTSLVHVLQEAGYRAQAVTSAQDCVEVTRKTAPDMIIMNIMMPGMNADLVSGLRKDVPEISGVPVALLSGMSEEQGNLCEEDAGMTGYLLKPYRKSVLLDCVERCIASVA
jgi:CheY-like chemotaxis protein